MSDRVILAVKFTPAGAGSQVRRAVGGFLRYVQHRDLHPVPPPNGSRPDVSGLLKYVAFRDQASRRADLFGPAGALTSEDRKAFAAYVGTALDQSRPQLFRARDGQLRDRRRAVYRLVISPEQASGLDLRRLTSAAMDRLARESGVDDLRWIAAIHRNTTHYHVHLVVAGMHRDGAGYRRVDLTKARLAAMKEELASEIGRQREEQAPFRSLPAPASETTAAASVAIPAIQAPRSWQLKPRSVVRGARRLHRVSSVQGSLTTLRMVAHRYRRRIERELEDAYRQSQWEYAA